MGDFRLPYLREREDTLHSIAPQTVSRDPRVFPRTCGGGGGVNLREAVEKARRNTLQTHSSTR